MSFEAFSKKLTKALQYFDDTGRPKHDGDVIDWIWRHVQSGELSQHMSALKVGQSIHLRTSKQILQEIAKEVPNLSKASNFEPRISEIQQGSSGSGGFTFDGSTPSSGAHTSDGKLYCGTYSPSRWFSDDVKPFHEQIGEHRDQHPLCVAEYAIENGISERPSFKWWIPFVLKKRDRIISKTKSSCWTRTLKCGIEIPKNQPESCSRPVLQ
jgi:hypothetical protein